MVSSIQKKQLFPCWIEFSWSSKKRPIILITSYFFKENPCLNVIFSQKKQQQQQRHFRIWIQLPDRHLNLLNLLKFMFNSATLEAAFLAAGCCDPCFLITRQQAGKGKNQNGSIFFGGRNDSVKIPAICFGWEILSSFFRKWRTVQKMLGSHCWWFSALNWLSHPMLEEKNQMWHPPGFSYNRKIDIFPEIFETKKNLQLLQDAIASRICCTPTYHTSFRSHDRREGVVCSLDFVHINELPFDLCTVTTREGSSPSDCCTILTNSSKSVPSGLPFSRMKTSTLNTSSFAHKASSSTTFNNDISCIQTSRRLQGSCNFHPHFYAWMSLTLWSWFCTPELSPPAVGSPQVTTCPFAKIAANALKDPWIFSTPPDLSRAQKNSVPRWNKTKWGWGGIWFVGICWD